MKLSEFDPVIQNALAAWVLLRSLGYSADDLYFGYELSTQSIAIVLKYNSQEVSVRIGKVYYSAEEAQQRWNSIGKCWNSGSISEQEMSALLGKPAFKHNAVEIVKNLLNEGLGSDELKDTMSRFVAEPDSSLPN